MPNFFQGDCIIFTFLTAVYENSSVSTFFPTFEKPPVLIYIIQTFFKLEYSCFTLLCHFLLYSKVNEPCCCCLVTSVVCNSVQSYGTQSARLPCPWDPLGKSTGVSCHVLLQGIFLTQGLNPGLLYCRQILYHWAPRKAPESATGIHISPLFWISRKALLNRFIQVGF